MRKSDICELCCVEKATAVCLNCNALLCKGCAGKSGYCFYCDAGSSEDDHDGEEDGNA